MKLIKVLAIVAMAVSLATVAQAEDKKPKGTPGKCCAKASEAGKKCEHKCCVEAQKAGKNCEKCGGKNS